jgi:hypothetical protein
MYDPVQALASARGFDPASALRPPPKLDCRRCQADLLRLPPSARFCPKCGFTLKDLGVARTAPTGARPAYERDDVSPLDLLAPWPRVQHWCATLLKLPPPLPAAADDPDSLGAAPVSPMVQGYATALYNLGYRYEHSAGARSNPEEAVRCYFKAARLGNPQAVARLTPDTNDSAAGPHAGGPQELPADAGHPS